MSPAPQVTDMASAEDLVNSKIPLIMETVEEAIRDGSAKVSFSGDEKDTTTITIYTNGDMNSEYTDRIFSEKSWNNLKRGFNVGHELKCELGMCHPDAPKSATMPKYNNATDISEHVPCTNNEGIEAGCNGSGGGMHPRSLGMNTVIDTVAKPHFVAQPFVMLVGVCFGLLMLFFLSKRVKSSLEERERSRQAAVLPRFEKQMVQASTMRETDDSDDESQLNSLNLVVVDLD